MHSVTLTIDPAYFIAAMVSLFALGAHILKVWSRISVSVKSLERANQAWQAVYGDETKGTTGLVSRTANLEGIVTEFASKARRNESALTKLKIAFHLSDEFELPAELRNISSAIDLATERERISAERRALAEDQERRFSPPPVEIRDSDPSAHHFSVPPPVRRLQTPATPWREPSRELPPAERPWDPEVTRGGTRRKR